MRKIKEVLRLKLDAGLTHEQISAALKISKGVVAKYVGLAMAAGLDWATIQTLDETGLQQKLVGSPHRTSQHVQPDFGRIHQELRRKGMTLMLLWEEYRAEYAFKAEMKNSPDWGCSHLAETVRFELTEDLHPRQFSRLIH